MPHSLNETEKAVYEFLLDFLSEHTYQPSVREIGKRFGIKSTKTVSQILHAIARKGYIELDPARSRGVKLLGFASARRVQPVPCYDRLSREDPALRPEHRGRYITLDRAFVPTPEAFFVRAGDDAAAKRGVISGDYVLVCPDIPSSEIGDGELVVAREGERAIVRRLKGKGSAATLERDDDGGARIPAMPVRDRGDGQVLGGVCAVLRPPPKSRR
jgi:repressor LexA